MYVANQFLNKNKLKYFNTQLLLLFDFGYEIISMLQTNKSRRK